MKVSGAGRDLAPTGEVVAVPSWTVEGFGENDFYYSVHYSGVPSTTIQVDVQTQKRLKAVKDSLTYDELIQLMLDLVTPDEIVKAKEIRARAYSEWQKATADRIRKSRKNKRLF